MGPSRNRGKMASGPFRGGQDTIPRVFHIHRPRSWTSSRASVAVGPYAVPTGQKPPGKPSSWSHNWTYGQTRTILRPEADSAQDRFDPGRNCGKKAFCIDVDADAASYSPKSGFSPDAFAHGSMPKVTFPHLRSSGFRSSSAPLR